MTSKQFRNAILTLPLALAIWSPALAEEARKAYAIGMLTLKNKEWVKEYGPKTAEIIKRHGGRYLISGSPSEALEGSEYPANVLVVLEFPSLEKAKAWYQDPDYKPLIKLRQSGSSLNLYLMEGVK